MVRATIEGTLIKKNEPMIYIEFLQHVRMVVQTNQGHTAIEDFKSKLNVNFI